MLSKLSQKIRGRSPRPKTLDFDKEDALEQLEKYDTQFLIDDSGSMHGSRWDEARDALMGLVRFALRHDDDGVEIAFLNAVDAGKVVHYEDEVRELFQAVHPSSGTPTGERLEQILTNYIRRLEAAQEQSEGAPPAQSGLKPLNLIVITDGEPSDDPESVIIAAARRLDTGQFPLTQVGIQFIQVGDDKAASRALRELDDHLGESNAVRDMVDTRPFTGKALTPDLLIAMLLGGINRRVDNIQKPRKNKK